MSESAVKAPSKSVSLQTLKLPTVSQQGMKALELINAKDLKFKDLESILSSDPMLMGILIKYANSPIYRKRIETTNVRQAMNLLGLDIVKSAILICTMRSYCEPSNPAKEMLWEKSKHLSIMAKLLARKISRKFADEIELTAMMSEMGGFVLSTNFADEYATVVAQAKEKQIAVEDEELYYFGLNRADVTALTLEKLRLPQTTLDVLDGYYKRKIPIEIKTETDTQLVILKLASILIAYKSKRELIKKDSLCLSLFETAGLAAINIDRLLDSYADEVAEGASF
ncbi:hypothetical protein MNBD_GAMMA23-1914 [hydrothermal vent metagenome]|uniref:HDOD domain-containing protein n=1 Tax=hydrothermal vent metagenome TaxID=652676 RepID=A0A3B1AIU2_9ZZZZ